MSDETAYFPGGGDARGAPGNPVQALLLDLAWQARGRVLHLSFAALEHLLRQQSWARERLAVHAGKTVLVAVDVDPPPGLPRLEIRAAIDTDGLLSVGDDDAPADATLRLTPSVDALFSMLEDGPRGLQRYLRVEGDATLAGTLGELSQQLRWDAEEDLSHLVGDVAARRAAGFASRAVRELRDLGDRAWSGLARFAAGGSRVVVRPQLEVLAESAAALDQRLRALEARAERLRAATV